MHQRRVFVKTTILFWLFYRINCEFYNNTDVDLSKCETYYSKSDGAYDRFFKLNQNSTNSLIFDFHFFVLAPSDAHIIITPSTTIKANADPVYEIVIGAGRNTHSAIRRAMRGPGKTKVTTKGLLSIFEPKPFWIHISKDGLIEVGRGTQDVAFIKWKDPDPLPLEFFSLGTWPSVEAKWYFDCDMKQVKEIEPILNDRQRLEKDYLSNYLPFNIPLLYDINVIDVMMTLNPIYMKLDEKDAKLESRFLMTQKWIDPKLLWLPTDYGNIESINLHLGEIWTPKIRIFSNVDDFANFLTLTQLNILFNGSVTLKAYLNLKTWCEAGNLNDWPEDSHVCKFPIGFFVDSEKINLNFEENNSSLEFKTEFEITETKVSYYTIKSDDSPSVEIAYSLKRVSDVYKLIYTTPLIVVCVSTLLMFFVSPFSYLKLTLAGFNLILVTAVVIQIALYIPGHPEKIPKILLGYNFAYFGIILSTIFSIIIINISRNKQRYPMSRILTDVVMNEMIQNILFVNIPKGFMDTPLQNSWILLGSLLDRIFFTIVLIFYGVILFGIL